MALIEKIFSIKRKLDNDYWDSRNWDRSCEITLEQVRLLLYKECDRRGRKVLFDSSTIEKVPSRKDDKPELRSSEIPSIVEVADGYTYIYKGQAADASVLGEMIFGAVAMNCKSVSLKIHIMNDPRRLMCTKIFSVPPPRISRVERKTDICKSNLLSRSTPLNVPLVKEEGVSLSFSLDRGDSGFYGEQSPYSSVGSTYDYFSMFDTWDGNATDEYCFRTPCGRKLSNSSNGSWQRRTFQSMATRFDLGQNNTLRVPSSVSSVDSQIYSNSSTSGTSDSLASFTSVVPRRGKLGLALLISVSEPADMDLVRRCMEHSPQLQSLVCRLRLATLSAGAGGAFVSTLHKAAGDAARWLSDLIYGPRLQSVWLELVTSEPHLSNKMADRLLTDLCSVLTAGDTKNTNFFISTLLTYVLTHHLGWVTTVSPYDTIDPQNFPSDQNDTRRPYNALWAQLTDLCGSIGFPPRSARTIIAGSKNVQFITRLLAVLTYFVRCGDVRKNDFKYEDCLLKEPKFIDVQNVEQSGKKCDVKECSNLKVPSFNNSNSNGSDITLTASDLSLKKTATLMNLRSLSGPDLMERANQRQGKLRRLPSMLPLQDSSDSGTDLSSEECDTKQVVFVLGDDEKLVGLKNKSNGRKNAKKSSKNFNESPALEKLDENEKLKNSCSDVCEKTKRDSPSKCCGQTLQHSKPIKHSGFKFEFDKYPQIVTNYMKSKNLEILDRHYIGKPGNLKLDNFQFDPTFVPPIQEERCETCYKCQLMESVLQTPTNASEMEYMNDMPRSEPQYAKETIVKETTHCELPPKSFVRTRKENTLVINVKSKESLESIESNNKVMKVKQVIEFPLKQVCSSKLQSQVRSGYDASLLGGVTNHYVPDLILQGTLSSPSTWEADLRRDLDLTSYLNKTLNSPVQAVAIIGDTNTWEVRLVGRDGCGGLSPLVGGILDAIPAMRQARVPTHQCFLYLESKLRELCVLSKTLADMLMSTDFCDIATLTKSLNIDVNDVPLLLAVATTHTPQVAMRYGISYR